MSRTGDDFTDHINAGGWDSSPCTGCNKLRLEEALKIAADAGYTVIPPVVTLTAN